MGESGKHGNFRRHDLPGGWRGRNGSPRMEVTWPPNRKIVMRDLSLERYPGETLAPEREFFMSTALDISLHPVSILLAIGAGLIAGAVNTVASGGTILTFPTLIWLGLPPVLANTTNNVGIWPGNLSGAWGLRRELATLPRRWLCMVIPAVLGGAVGAWMLLHTPSPVFADLAPWLILAATVLTAVEPLLRKLQESARRRFPDRSFTRKLEFALFVQFFVSIYGGYFGAGMGMMILTVLGLLGSDDLQANIGLKNLIALATNGVAVVAFVLAHAVVWKLALLLAAGTIVGGWLGAVLARMAGRERVRGAVIAVGIVMSLALMAHLHAM